MRRAMMTLRDHEEIDRLVYHMPTVATHATNNWAVGFARSIQRQAQRRNWTPSQKQLNLMRSLVSDLFAHEGNEGGDFDVVE
ncbi:hypothetical protein SAMN05444404_1669 [Ruegeria lacuscaerulensis ITI-1157]|nr:hypothetical protein SAMN05444404_1669 [Ruegeria lacuscaerulensis ITI-1157]